MKRAIVALIGTIIIAACYATVAYGNFPDETDYNSNPTHAPNSYGTQMTASAVNAALGNADAASTTAKSGGNAVVLAGAPAGSICWHNGTLWAKWGAPGFETKVLEDRYWCAPKRGGLQNYRSTKVYLQTPNASICGADNGSQYQKKISGGDGYTYTNAETGGHFTCGITYIAFHPSRWQQWTCNTQGLCSWVAQEGW